MPFFVIRKEAPRWQRLILGLLAVGFFVLAYLAAERSALPGGLAVGFGVARPLVLVPLGGGRWWGGGALAWGGRGGDRDAGGTGYHGGVHGGGGTLIGGNRRPAGCRGHAP